MQRPVSDWVIQQVTGSLKKHGVVLWFDPEEAFTDLLPEITLPKCTVIPWNGSYYEMRHKAEAAFHSLNKAQLALGHTLLMYVPAEKDKAKPLREFYMAGHALQLSLRVMAQQALFNVVPAATLTEILSNRNPSLADLDQMAEGDQPNVLKAIFGTTAEADILTKYLTEGAWEQQVDDRQALDDLIGLCQSAVGFAVGPSSHAALKEALPRHLLLSELRAGLNPQPPAVATLPMPNEAQLSQTTVTLQRLRQSEGTRDHFAKLAQAVQQATGADRWGIDPAKVQGADTFPFLEAAALAAVEAAVIDHDDLQTANDLVDRYRSSFWVVRDGRRMEQWEAARLAVDLCRTADLVTADLAKAKHVNPADAVSYYSAESGGWWAVDSGQRRMEATVANLEEAFELERLLQRARHVYEQAALRMADRFESGLDEHRFQFGTHLHQTDLFATVVEPLLNKGEKVAFFLVDSLRFEMGRELHDTVSAREKTLVPCIGTPPTITQIGMAALMPGAEKGVTLADTGGKLGLAVDGTTLVGSAARMEWLKARTGGGWAVDVTLDVLVSNTERSVKNLIDKRSLVVVRSQEIDAQGEEDNRSSARQTMSNVLKVLRRGIDRLRKLGFTRIVITADHGHLFAEEYGEDRKMDAPAGQAVELHRRCWIGRNPSPPKHTLHFKAAELGLGSDLELVFPRGLAIFRSKGGAESYFHGGLSLQELVLPVITMKLEPPTKTKNDENAIQIRPKKPAVTNRMFMVELLYTGTFDAMQKVVRVVALKDDLEVGRASGATSDFNDHTQEIVLESQNTNGIFVQLSQELEGQGELTVQVLDPKTGLVLARVNLPFELD